MGTQGVDLPVRDHISPVEIDNNLDLNYNFKKSVADNAMLLDVDNRKLPSNSSNNSNANGFIINEKSNDDETIDEKIRELKRLKEKILRKANLKRFEAKLAAGIPAKNLLKRQ